MKERPILFSAPMVRAIIDGSKKQTRRAFSARTMKAMRAAAAAGEVSWFMDEGRLERNDLSFIAQFCPYGKPYDRLWVRETWRIGAWDCETSGIAVDYRADSTARREWLNPFGNNDEVFERYWSQCISDCVVAGLETTVDGGYTWEPGHSPCRWRPSIHMPRWASRINLEITIVSVERLQDITEQDAIDEGIELVKSRRMMWRDYSKPIDSAGGFAFAERTPAMAPVLSYRTLWESINGPGSWDANPWCWVVEFKPVQP